MKTVRRDWLLRRARQGKLVLVRSYRFDDVTGAERDMREMPVEVIPPDDPDWWRNRKEGVCYVHQSEFDGDCGRAYESGPGIVHLRVHSNLNYDFRVLP